MQSIDSSSHLCRPLIERLTCHAASSGRGNTFLLCFILTAVAGTVGSASAAYATTDSAGSTAAQPRDSVESTHAAVQSSSAPASLSSETGNNTTTSTSGNGPAQDKGGIPAMGQLTSGTGGTGYLGGEAGFGLIDGDPFLVLGLGGALRLGKIGLGVMVPLRFRIWAEGEPSFDLRDEDWDDPSDYFRAIRFVEYGVPRDPLYGRVGELTATTIGHGTIMNLYYNVLDIDSHQTGLRLNVNALHGGVESVVDNVVAPSIGGARMYLRPWSFVEEDSFWTKWSVGVTVMGDAFADDAAHEADIPGGIMVLGLDTDFQVVDTPLLTLTPYTDLNYIWQSGVGLHTGVMANIALPLDITSTVRLEARFMSTGYLPGYFGSLYEIERLGFPGVARKSLLLSSATGGKGIYGEAAFGFAGLITVAGIYEDSEGPDNSSLTLRAEVPGFGPVRMGAYYSRQQIDSLTEAFEIDERSLLVVEARVQVNPILYLVFQGAHRWTVEKDGKPAGAWEWNAGTGISIAF